MRTRIGGGFWSLVLIVVILLETGALMLVPTVLAGANERMVGGFLLIAIVLELVLACYYLARYRSLGRRIR